VPKGRSLHPIRVAALLTVVSLATTVASLEAAAELELEGFWIRAMPPGQPMAAGYGDIVNRGDRPIQIRELSTNIAQNAELHSSIHENGRVRMVPMASEPLAPGARIQLTPGGDHLMLMGVTQSPQLGDKVELCIAFMRTDVTDSGRACHEIPVLRKAPSQGDD